MIHVYNLLFDGNGNGELFYTLPQGNEIIKSKEFISFKISFMHNKKFSKTLIFI